MKRKLSVIMTALMMLTSFASVSQASEIADAVIVADEAEIVSAENEEIESEFSEEEIGEVLVEAVEEVSEDEAATVQEGEDEPAAIAESGTCGDSLTWTLSAEGTLTISGTGKMTDWDDWSGKPWSDLDVRKVIIEYGVTSIGNCAFWGCSSLANVSIANSVVSIGSYAFMDTMLTSIDIPDSITIISDWAFYSCDELTDLVVGNGVNYIGERAFSLCDSLSSVTISNSVITIDNYAFSDCPLNSLTLGESLIEIGDYAFSSTDLTKVIIPDSVTTIGDHAFAYCSNLTYIFIPENVSSIHSQAFSGSYSVCIYGYSGTAAETAAFNNSRSFISVNCGDNLIWTLNEDGVLTISGAGEMWNFSYFYDEDSTTDAPWFRFKDQIISVVMKEGVTSVGSYAFYNYSNLKSVTVSSGLSSVGEYALYGTAWMSKQEEFAVVGNILVNYQGNGGAVVIPDGITAIGKNAFERNKSITSVVIPDSVISIGDYAFFFCEGITSVTLGNNVTTIGTAAFDGCNSLTSMTIPKSVISIGDMAVGYKYGESQSGKGSDPMEFTIYGYSGTAAETYAATSDKFTFVALDSSTATLGTCKISSLTNVAKGIKIKWSKVSGADGYYIYRKTGSGSYKKIKTITSASTVSYTDKKVVDKNGTTYTYKVAPYSGSTEGTGSEKTTVRLTGTTLTSVKNSAASKAKVKWTAVTDVTGYQIQYSTSSSFASSKKKTVSGASKSSKTLTGLTKGSTYYVRIRTYKTVNGTKYYSTWSSKLKVTITK